MTGPDGVRLRVDPTACTAHGLCAVLLAERVRLDEWGYPIIDPTALDRARPIPGQRDGQGATDLLAHARAAAAACPARALRLVPTAPRRSS